MADSILIDTGPLVSFLCRDDDYHEWSVAQFKKLRAPFLTCESVLSETIYLVNCDRTVLAKLCSFLEEGYLELAFDLPAERRNVFELMQRYHEVPMSLADACLVRMSELMPRSVVFTVDSDFRIYRRQRRQMIRTIMPDDA